MFKVGEKVFSLAIEGDRTTEGVVLAGNYDWGFNLLNSKYFPLRQMPKGPRGIIYLELDCRSASSEAVLAEAERRGLKRPQYEDAMYFGEQYPEEQRNRPIVFLHEPWQPPNAGPLSVFMLGCDQVGRSLLPIRFDTTWMYYGCRFAFICE